MELNVIILEDDNALNIWYKLYFTKLSFPSTNITITACFTDFISKFKDNFYNVAIIDYYLPDTNGLSVLEFVKTNNPLCNVIIISSTKEVDLVASLIKEGAIDFLQKPLDDEKLTQNLINVWDQIQVTTFDESDVRIEQPLSETNDIVYKSNKIRDILVTLSRCAVFDSTILIRGESGTGKELVARRIYSMSQRNQAPFVVLNISSLPESLIESELFGHKKGAFTGAVADRIGRFEEADGGTIFIDEIGDISPTVQVKLLRAIQFKTFQRVGDNKQIKSDVRIITATSRNLEEMMQNGDFREDLYYRLSVISVKVPPLRERKEDIEVLSKHFLKLKCSLYNKPVPLLPQNALEVLIKYNYPGNVRELENIIEYSIVMCRTNCITANELPNQVKSFIEEKSTNVSDSIIPHDLDGYGLDEFLAIIEKKLILNTLKKSEGNQSAAARILKISERKLRFKMEKLNIVNIFRSKK